MHERLIPAFVAVAWRAPQRAVRQATRQNVLGSDMFPWWIAWRMIRVFDSSCDSRGSTVADFHRAMVATEKLVIGCRPVRNWTKLQFLGRVALVAHRPIVVKLSRERSVGRSVCRSVCLSSALWKTADRIWMPFGIVGRTGSGMRQVVGFGDRSTGKGSFEGEFWAPHCNQWGLYGVPVRQRRDAALFPNYFGQTCFLCCTVNSE